MVPKSALLLMTAGQHAPSADNSQPWHFTCLGKSIKVGYDAGSAHDPTFPAGHPAAPMTMGSMAEHMLSAAACANVRAELKRAARASFSIQLLEPTDTAEDLSMNCPVLARHTNRFPFRPDPLPSSIRAKIAAEQLGAARMQVTTDRAQRRRIATVVATASRLRFRIKDVHDWLVKSLRFSPEEVAAGHGLDVATLPLPPGGRHVLRLISDWHRMSALNRLGAYRLLARMDSASLAQAPAILAVIAPNTAGAQFDAGRLMARVWIDLNAAGIAVHPYYVLTDMLVRHRNRTMPEHLRGEAERLAPESDAIFRVEAGEAGEAVQMILRVGYPTVQPPRSLRRPMSELLEDRSGE